MTGIISLSFIFAAALISPLMWKYFKHGAGYLLSLIPLGVFIRFLLHIGDGLGESPIYYSLSWFPQLGVRLSFYLDGLSLLMGLLISGIGFLITLYASGYLAHHHQQGRFFCFLFLFMGAMLGVVLSGNLMSLFVFWELTSISSYLLIGYYHEKEESRKLALQALLVTGLGGAVMLMGFIVLGMIAGTYEIPELLAMRDSIAGHKLAPLAAGLVLIGALTKSAQFPFHFWLPNAMAGPAPVSAYLHSATMVKAGVFLIARLTPIFNGLPVWTLPLILIGTTTMLLGGGLGLLQTDLKKILAYTTLSVLGLLTMLLGLGTDMAIKSAVVFLVGHALYKACLFMVAGIVDHETGERDVRRLGGLRRVMPLTAAAGLLAALSKAGFPPFFGFMGKEYVYKAGTSLDLLSTEILVSAMLANMLLLALAFKAGIHPFWHKLDKEGEDSKLPGDATFNHVHDPSWSMLAGPLVLSILGLALGFFPGSVVTPLISPAVSAVVGHPVDFTLSLWHGFNLPLLLSLVTLTGGILIFLFREKLWRFFHAEPVGCYSFTKAYFWGLDRFVRSCKVVTAIIQSGYLRIYILVILGFTLALAGTKLLILGIPSNGGTMSIAFPESLDIAISVVIIGAALMSILAKSRITAILALGAIGFGIAAIYVRYGAPDLGITQILVETLTVVFLMFVIFRLPEFKVFSNRSTIIFDGIFSVVCGIVMAALVWKGFRLGLFPNISEQYGEWSYVMAKGKNVVNVILVDFRALDTLGEITVLAIAAIGIMALLSSRFRMANPSGKQGHSTGHNMVEESRIDDQPAAGNVLDQQPPHTSDGN